MQNDLIIHGVGTSQLVFKDGSFLTIDSAQDLQISSSATVVEQEGGDSLYALTDFVTKKTDKITITNAVFNLETLKAQTGALITTGSEVLVPNDTKLVATGACQLTDTTGVVVDSVVGMVVETGVALTNIGATGTPTGTQFTVTALGAVKVDAALDSKNIEFSYYKTDATGTVTRILEDTIPKICEFRHTIIDDEGAVRVDIRAFKCKPSGAFTYDASRGKAYSPKLEFSVLNAKRTDKRVMDYNVTDL